MEAGSTRTPTLRHRTARDPFRLLAVVVATVVPVKVLENGDVVDAEAIEA